MHPFRIIVAVSTVVALVLAAYVGYVYVSEALSSSALVVRLDVPFTPQAPTGDWVEPWSNACEEASIVMVDHYYRGEPLTSEAAVLEIRRIFGFKELVHGVSADESMSHLAQVIQASEMRWTAEVRSEPTLSQMLAELDHQRPIIAPVYAPELENPLYGPSGPDYHVVVISGYDPAAREFLIHDPGTSRGENLRFSYETVMSAIHDLHPEDYASGLKAVLFTAPGEETIAAYDTHDT